LNPDHICYFIIDEIVLCSVYISAPRSIYIIWLVCIIHRSNATEGQTHI